MNVCKYSISAKWIWTILIVALTGAGCRPQADDNSIAILVALTNGNASESTAGTCATTEYCKMFATSSALTKNAGIAGADNNCATDANKPSGGGTYKALIVDGDNRRACQTAS